MRFTEAELRRRLLRVMVKSGAGDARVARRRARELARFLVRGRGRRKAAR